MTVDDNVDLERHIIVKTQKGNELTGTTESRLVYVKCGADKISNGCEHARHSVQRSDDACLQHCH